MGETGEDVGCRRRADDLPTFGTAKPKKAKRDAFIYMIAGDKVRAPAAAQALIGRL